MNKFSCLTITGLCFLLLFSRLYAQSNFGLTENFDRSVNGYQKTGRGICRISNSKLTTQDAYLSFGKADWADYEAEFNARVPSDAEQVQICAGFHALNRDDRYIVMLRGGVQQNIYLARLGYMGTDDYLALRELEFRPEPGTWYHFKIQIAAGRIRVFINHESLPRIDVKDKYAGHAASGPVTLGGSWIANEFNQLVIRPLSVTQIPTSTKEYSALPREKEPLRVKNRLSYHPVVLKTLKPGRNICSLNGRWLFSPGYETTETEKAVSPKEKDDKWHVMTVPDFWNPIRVWLHGERYNTGSKGVSDNYFDKETARCENYTFDYKKTNMAWYRQWIDLPEGIQGKQLHLAFDAVSKVAEVYINGVKAGSHIGMFGDFKVDGTKLFKPGRNLVTVKVTRDYVKDIQDPDKVVDVAVTVPVTQKMMKDIAHGFFNEDPAGIWQPVTLEITDAVRIEDVFIKPTLQGAAFDITVNNGTGQTEEVSIATNIAAVGQKEILYHSKSPLMISLKAGEQKTVSYTVDGLKPRLWSPEHPDLYNFEFALAGRQGREDMVSVRSGFRTFTVSGDYLYLNGKRYWLRGANQSAAPLAPNDTLLADRFSKLMKDGNIAVTRTHTVPATETWMNAYDENGIGVSYEGTWPWLFLGNSMPDLKLVDLWKNEFYDLLKKYRNHPSLLLWTVNNEMKFYDNDPDSSRANQKMHIISDVVRHMRLIDPTRPVVFDSNYKRDSKKFQSAFKDVDDGDIDDVHAYLNWYDYSIFDYFKGEWQKKNKNAGRPLISQEMSTGYTDETGHATRFYNYVHQNPESLAGNFTKEFNDPKYFMAPQAFITKELAEALRRSDGQAAGILHFALITWFNNVYMADKIKPFPVYFDMQKALQPVLVSAELWGRHFYAGSNLPVRFCVINDREDGTQLPASDLQWKIVSDDGKALAAGNIAVPPVGHYQRCWMQPVIRIPDMLPANKTPVRILLTLKSGGKLVSQNDYPVLLAAKPWLNAASLGQKHLRVFDATQTLTKALDYLGIAHETTGNVMDLFSKQADVYLLGGLDSAHVTQEQLKSIRMAISKGAQVLLTGSGTAAHDLYPEFVRSLIRANGEITTMDIPESPIFNDIGPLETRYFNNNRSESPAAISGAFRINRNEHVIPLASYTQVHGYLTGEMTEREQRLDQMKGFPILEINEKGRMILAEIKFEKAATDPVAAKLLVNILKYLCSVN